MDLGCLVSRKDKTVEEEDDKYKPKKKNKNKNANKTDEYSFSHEGEITHLNYRAHFAAVDTL
jgi:hypothetical protein